MVSEELTGRERMVRTLRFMPVDRAPRQLWYLPGVEMFRQDELNAMLERFPSDILQSQPVDYDGQAERECGEPTVAGIYVDEWELDVTAENITAVFEAWMEC